MSPPVIQNVEQIARSRLVRVSIVALSLNQNGVLLAENYLVNQFNAAFLK
jgi:hypothetical protein